jgi:hypothetical protein
VAGRPPCLRTVWACAARSADGSISARGASFGWPVKPPDAYKVKAKDTPCEDVLSGQKLPRLLQPGEVLHSVDGQKQGTEAVRVRSAAASSASSEAAAAAAPAVDGWVKLAALEKLPAPPLAEWAPPQPGIAGMELDIAPGELVLVSGPVASVSEPPPPPAPN